MKVAGDCNLGRCCCFQHARRSVANLQMTAQQAMQSGQKALSSSLPFPVPAVVSASLQRCAGRAMHGCRAKACPSAMGYGHPGALPRPSGGTERFDPDRECPHPPRAWPAGVPNRRIHTAPRGLIVMGIAGSSGRVRDAPAVWQVIDIMVSPTGFENL